MIGQKNKNNQCKRNKSILVEKLKLKVKNITQVYDVKLHGFLIFTIKMSKNSMYASLLAISPLRAHLFE